MNTKALFAAVVIVLVVFIVAGFSVIFYRFYVSFDYSTLLKIAIILTFAVPLGFGVGLTAGWLLGERSKYDFEKGQEQIMSRMFRILDKAMTTRQPVVKPAPPEPPVAVPREFWDVSMPQITERRAEADDYIDL